MNVAIIKYNAGNIRSVDHALRRLGVEASITDDHDSIRSADRVIFPGVGEAKSTMAYLKERLKKIRKLLIRKLPSLRKPKKLLKQKKVIKNNFI